jgi:thiamine-phosphate pyrophosphorylase
MKPLAECRLYGFVDSAFLRDRAPAALARELCEGGTDLIQWRAKGWPVERVSAVARELLPVTREYGVRLVINDHFGVARDLGVEVCHLGQEDFFDAGYRVVSDLRGASARPEIGLSTHAPEDAQRAMLAKPDYIATGPVFATGTKPEARPVTLDYVRWAADHVALPWFAIGGISLTNLRQVLDAGARRICVVSAILNVPDIAAECRRYLEVLAEYPLSAK